MKILRINIFLILFLCCLASEALTITHLRVDQLSNPSGVDSTPQFSWWLESEERGCSQTSYCIVISTDKNFSSIIYDSGDISSSQSVRVSPAGLSLEPSCRYYWKVTVHDNQGNIATSTEDAYFETGLMQTGWGGAQWITCLTYVPGSVLEFRKQFTVDSNKSVKRAFLHSSSLGMYDALLNGQKVGHVLSDGTVRYEELKPGWTDYRKHIQYNTFDVTKYIKSGENVLGSIVAEGWWNGSIGYGIYNSSTLGYLAKLVLVYDDSSTEEVVTDMSWKCRTSKTLLVGGIYDGEEYDSRQEDEWQNDTYDTTGWMNCIITSEFNGEIISQPGSRVLELQDRERKPQQMTLYEATSNSGTDFGLINIISTQPVGVVKIKKGQTLICDFGQNVVGFTPFKVKGSQGTKVRIRYSEMLNDDGSVARGNDGPGGSLYLSNLRTAKATLYYTLKGNIEGENYRTWATYYGFRYCEVTADNDIDLIDIHALPISSAVDLHSSLTTNNPGINQLVNNFQWGQLGNFMSIPTDCPQRDERWGWTGDAQVFCRTGMYNAEAVSFYRKFLQDLRDSQNDDGSYPEVAPHIGCRNFGAAGWGDAGIIIPYVLYSMTGDDTIIREHYESMQKYMQWLSTQTGDGYLYQGAYTTFGDWLAYDKCANRYVSVAYYAYDASLMSKMAGCLSSSSGDDYSKQSDKYQELYANIKQEFLSRYWTPEPVQTSQTALLLALAFDLLDVERTDMALAMLKKSIADNNGLLSTGFLGTSVFLPTLSKYNLDGAAYNLILQRGNPSWLYSVDQGATTIWERWDSYTKEKGFGPSSMNSFNHYAYGAVGEWMYRYMGGIECGHLGNGFKQFVLQPRPDFRFDIPDNQERITKVACTYCSEYGEIVSNWYYSSEEKDATFEFKIPANTEAIVYLPNEEGKAYFEGNKEATDAQGVTFIENKDGKLIIHLVSGRYSFSHNQTTTSVTNEHKENIVIKDGKIDLGNNHYKMLEIYNLRGHLVKSIKTPKQTIDINNLPKDCYVVTGILSNGHKVTRKIIE